VPTGRVALTWEQGQAGTLRLLWREIGGPSVAEPGHRGFCGRLVDNLARLQLGGAVQQDWRPDGLRCVITAAGDSAPGGSVSEPSFALGMVSLEQSLEKREPLPYRSAGWRSVLRRRTD
jgi:hypothetical protein